MGDRYTAGGGFWSKGQQGSRARTSKRNEAPEEPDVQERDSSLDRWRVPCLLGAPQGEQQLRPAKPRTQRQYVLTTAVAAALNYLIVVDICLSPSSQHRIRTLLLQQQFVRMVPTYRTWQNFSLEARPTVCSNRGREHYPRVSWTYCSASSRFCDLFCVVLCGLRR